LDETKPKSRFSKKKIVAMVMLVLVGAVSVLALQKTKSAEQAYSEPVDFDALTFEGVPKDATDLLEIDVAGKDTEFFFAVAQKYVGAMSKFSSAASACSSMGDMSDALTGLASLGPELGVVSGLLVLGSIAFGGPSKF